MIRRYWSPSEIETVRALYPETPTHTIATQIGRTISQVYQCAARLGLEKSEAYLASPAACRLRPGDNIGAAYRFGKGHVPANKGLRRPGWAPGRMKETQFKQGERRGKAAENWCPIGTIRADSEGFLRIKVREARKGEAYGFGNTRVWPLLNRHVWEQAHGPIPANHIVAFKDRDRANCALDNLELISCADNMRRNSVHRLPKELAQVIQLTGALNRQIRRRQRGQEQTLGSAQSPVRDPGSVTGRGQTDGSGTGAGHQLGGAHHRRERQGGSEVSGGNGSRARAGRVLRQPAAPAADPVQTQQPHPAQLKHAPKMRAGGGR